MSSVGLTCCRIKTDELY